MIPPEETVKLIGEALEADERHAAIAAVRVDRVAILREAAGHICPDCKAGKEPIKPSGLFTAYGHRMKHPSSWYYCAATPVHKLIESV